MSEFLFDIDDNSNADNIDSEAGATPALPENWPAESDWTPHLREQMLSDGFRKMQQFVSLEREQHEVYPEHANVFRAFELTSFANTCVVILGQDPYHGPGQAHGLSFSVPQGVTAPPSLKNIFKELYSEGERVLPDLKTVSGNLESWAAQGVLLLNTVLTVRQSDAGSHQKKGWEQFTNAVITSLNEHPDRVVFILWGKQAEKKKTLIDDRHTLIVSVHPSPLSASRGFFGSRPFSLANAALIESGRLPVEWISD